MHIEPRRFRHPPALARSAKASLLSRERHGRAISREVHVGASEEGYLHARFERRELGRLVRAVFCCAFVEEAAAAQPATRALLHARRDVRDVASRGRGAFAKHDCAGVVRAGEDAIGRQDVKMYKATKRRVEPLHEGDSAGLAVRARRVLLPARDFLHEDAALRRQRVRAEREYATNFVRRGQHPLPHRDVGQDVIHQMSRGVAHPPGRARRTRSAAFARVRDDDFLAALRAHDAQKTVRQDPATQIPGAKLADTRLSDASKQMFNHVTIGDKSVAKWVKDWQSVAKQLGEVDAEKTAVEAKLASGTTPAEALKARNTGIRVINAFLGMLALDAPDAATRARILGPVEAALAKVARRAKPATTDGSKGGEAEGSPSGTGTPPVTP